MSVLNNLITCNNCGATVNGNAKFCSACGKEIINPPTKKYCLSCGEELYEKELFCSKCGSSSFTNNKPQQTNNGNYNTPLYEENARPKGKIGLLIGGIILTVAIVIGIFGVAIFGPIIKYNRANDYQEAGDYYEAYNMFVDLGDYKQSKEEVNATILLWTADALGSEDPDEVNRFCNTVTLSYDQYTLVYSAVVLYINGHTDAEHWYDYSGTTNTDNVIKILEKLPVTYENTSTYLELFNALKHSSGYTSLIEEHASTIRNCWSIKFVKNLVEHDSLITEFLKGYWTTSYGSYYFEFYGNDEGTTSSSFNIPSASKPAGTKYYDIEGMTYYWLDKDSNKLAEVFDIEITDYDTIRVYSHYNNRTYILYR